MNEGEMLIAIFNAIGALSNRMGGESPLLRIKDEHGNINLIYPSISNVTWFNQAAEAEGQPDGHEVSHSMRCSQHGGTDATLKAPQQAVALTANYRD